MMFLRCAMWRYWIKRWAKLHTFLRAKIQFRPTQAVRISSFNREKFAQTYTQHHRRWCDAIKVMCEGAEEIKRKKKKQIFADAWNFVMLEDPLSLNCVMKVTLCKVGCEAPHKRKSSVSSHPFSASPSIHRAILLIHSWVAQRAKHNKKRTKERRKPEQTLLYVNVDISYPWRLEHSAKTFNMQR